MAKATKGQYTLVTDIEEIVPIVKNYRQILDNRNSEVFSKFSNFTYWYYFPNLNIYIPNLFLAYKEMANEPYPEHPYEDYGMDGGPARKALLNLECFKEIKTSKKELNNSQKGLVELANCFIYYNENNAKKTRIFELKEKFFNSFNDITSFNMNELKKEKSQNKEKSKNKRYQQFSPENKNETSTKQLHEIVQRIKEYIIKINEIHESYKGDSLFNENGSTKLWRDIEKNCIDYISIDRFAMSLRILIFDKTQERNPKYTKDNRKPFYKSRYPKRYLENETVKYFMHNIVAKLRNKVAHELKLNPDVLEELLNIRALTEQKEYQKLQIEILKRFEDSMKILLEILKKELKHSQNH